MRKTLSSTVLLLIVATLASCAATDGKTTAEKQLSNPLFAELYAESMVDRLVELEIMKNPILEDAAKKAFVEEQRKHWLEVGRDAREQQRKGMIGNVIPMGEYAKGEMLYVENRLYFSSLFEADPLPALHVYLTTVVDPRDTSFPDDTAMDLGKLDTPYGAQSYDVPAVSNPLLYRTVVLWDNELGRLHSFAQMSK